jgi:hypothetical protein
MRTKSYYKSCEPHIGDHHEWNDGEWEGRDAGVVLFNCIKCGVGKYCEVQDPDYSGVVVSE